MLRFEVNEFDHGLLYRQLGEACAFKYITGASVLALSFGVSFDWQIQLFTKLAHPADLTRGNSYYKGIGGHILVDNRARANERIFAYG
ncbi:hypothetical protein D3C71_2022970 [compost metagenome]